jgi:hypothetical protein
LGAGERGDPPHPQENAVTDRIHRRTRSPTASTGERGDPPHPQENAATRRIHRGDRVYRIKLLFL